MFTKQDKGGMQEAERTRSSLLLRKTYKIKRKNVADSDGKKNKKKGVII